ncbi:MAG: glutathione S-transferase family protein [Alphaproteobacteria bacterium]
MTEPIVFGAAYSVYVRAVRLALTEKGVPYRLEEVDIFAEGGPPPGYLERHPFARIPAFEHDGFRLYEATAISLYVDEAFEGPPLMPENPKARARVHQLLGILDNYAYRTLVWDIFVERVRVPQSGGTSDEAKIAAALGRARTCLAAIESLMGEGPWLAAGRLSLADLRAFPIFALFRKAPEGTGLLAETPKLLRWFEAMPRRPSVSATRSPIAEA